MMVAVARGWSRAGRYPLPNSPPAITLAWARGAVGSASDWQSEGQGFESPRVHQIFSRRRIFSAPVPAPAGLRRTRRPPAHARSTVTGVGTVVATSEAGRPPRLR